MSGICLFLPGTSASFHLETPGSPTQSGHIKRRCCWFVTPAPANPRIKPWHRSLRGRGCRLKILGRCVPLSETLLSKNKTYKADKSRSESSIYKRTFTMGFLKNQSPNLVNMVHCPQNKNQKVSACILSGHASSFKERYIYCSTPTNHFPLLNVCYLWDCPCADTLHK